MDLVDVIRAPKRNLKVNEWKSGTITRKHFPLRRSKRLPFGRGWSWRIVHFEAVNHNFRVLIRLNEEKEYYSAILAMDGEEFVRVICHHELHTSHNGWHCHFVRHGIENVHGGVLRDRDRMICWPCHEPGRACPVETFPVTRRNALSYAAARYRFEVQGKLI